MTCFPSARREGLLLQALQPHLMLPVLKHTHLYVA